MNVEERAHKVLRDMGPVLHISEFGLQLFKSGAVLARNPCKRISKQGAALLAGKWLRRMEASGLAVQSANGWRAA